MARSASAIAMPTPMTVNPSSRPTRAVTAPARSRSLVRAQASARTTRPPSSGIPGSRLMPGEDDVQRRRARRGSRASAPSARRHDRVEHAERQHDPAQRQRDAAVPRARSRARRAASGAWMLSGASPPTKPSTIVVDSTPYRRPTSAWASSWATTDTRKPTAIATPIEPLDRRREARGREGRLLRAEQRDDRDEDRPRERDPDLDPEQARDREAVAAHQAGTSDGTGVGGARPRTPRAPAARRPPYHHSSVDSATMTTPTAIVRLDPELLREQLDELLGAGSNVHDPGGKNSSWNSANAWSNRRTPPIPPTTVTTAITSPLVDRRRQSTDRRAVAARERERPRDQQRGAGRDEEEALRTRPRRRRMCCRSRASSTGTPSSVDVERRAGR